MNASGLSYNEVGVPYRRRISWQFILSALLIVVYYITVWRFSINFPISDDFTMLFFVNRVVETQDSDVFLQSLFSKSNEHILATTRLATFAFYKFFGTVNFKALCLLGNLSALLTYFVFLQYRTTGKTEAFSVLLITCMIFQYGPAESMLWGMAAISNFLALALALWSFHLLSKDGNLPFFLALVTSALAVITQGNGLLVPILATGFLLFERRYRKSIVMFALTLWSLWLYSRGTGELSSSYDFFGLPANAGKLLLFFSAFLGSAVGIGGSNYPVATTISLFPTATLGLIIIATTAYGLLVGKADSRVKVLLWINLYVIGTAVIVTLGRHEYGLSQALVSRYKIYSNCAVLATALYWLGSESVLQQLDNLLQKRARFFLYALPPTYTVLTFVFIPFFYLKIYSPIQSGKIMHANPEVARSILKESQRLGVFSPPQYPGSSSTE